MNWIYIPHDLTGRLEGDLMQIGLPECRFAQAIPLHTRIESYFKQNIAPLPWPMRMKFMRSAHELAMHRGFGPIPDVGIGKPISANLQTVAMKVLSLLFASFPIDPIYQEHMAEGNRRFACLVENDERFAGAKYKWKEMYSGERTRILGSLGLLCDEAYSSEDFSFEPTPDYALDETRTSSNGWYIRNDQSISINTLKACWNDFGSAMRVLVHEKRHHHVHQLTMALEEGSLPASSPFYEQAIRCDGAY